VVFGKDGTAIFRPSTGYWYLNGNLDRIVEISFRYGGSTDRIIIRDWEGDLRDTSQSYVRNPDTGI
jgi:hypothetical protein